MTADLILTNGRVYTVDPAHPWAEAVAVRDGRILAVGADADIAALAGPRTQRIDAAGRLVLPGLTDSHVHFLGWAERRHQVNLFGLTDLADVRERLTAALRTARPEEWIIGWGWDDSAWDARPTAAWLDRVTSHHPVMLARMDMHTWWVNSRVLEIAGITAETPDPPQSSIGRDATGQPNGLLSEWNALALVEAYIPQPSTAAQRRWLEEAVAAANRLGLTGIHDQRVEHEGQQSLRLFQTLRRDGQLTLRVHCNIASEHLLEASQLGLQAGLGDDTLWLGHVKAFADGTMGSRTAHMLAPFEGEPDNTGLVVKDTADLWGLIVAAGEAGFPISVHAIGDRAVRETLDVMSEWTVTRAAGSRLPMPQRIEHVQLIHLDDLGRLAQNGIVGAVQPVHLMTDWPTADRVWGERGRYAYAFRSLIDRGAILALGSDAPVAPLDPMLGIYAAVTRQDAAGQPAGGWYPDERLTMAEAIAGYTLHPAFLSGKDDRLGSIAPGKYADLVVLSQNLFDIEPAAIPQTRAELTLFNGEVVFEA
jgi:predicted amidohydrolase YtcJ